jgi:hypothetical protein
MRIISDLIGLIEEQKGFVADSMLAGANSWEAYQRLVGQSIGLQMTLDFINNLLEDGDANK